MEKYIKKIEKLTDTKTTESDSNEYTPNTKAQKRAGNELTASDLSEFFKFKEIQHMFSEAKDEMFKNVNDDPFKIEKIEQFREYNGDDGPVINDETEIMLISPGLPMMHEDNEDIDWIAPCALINSTNEANYCFLAEEESTSVSKRCFLYVFFGRADSEAYYSRGDVLLWCGIKNPVKIGAWNFNINDDLPIINDFCDSWGNGFKCYEMAMPTPISKRANYMLLFRHTEGQGIFFLNPMLVDVYKHPILE